MSPSLITTLLISPVEGWAAIQKANLSVSECYFRHVVPLGLIMPICGYIGVTQVGWPVAGRVPVMMENGVLEARFLYRETK